MKNLMRKLWIIALVAVLGFSMMGCDLLDESDGNGSGSGSGGPATFNIQNNTGFPIGGSFGGIWIKPSTSVNWGSNLLGWTTLSAGASHTITLSQPLSVQNVYDIRLVQATFNGHNFIRYGVTVTNGMTITFTANDFDDGSNLPSITIQNRTGVNFSSLHMRPSVSGVWGEIDFAWINNNNDRTVTIPIPPSNFTEFDIQARATQPAVNSFTMFNVSVSDGMNLIITSAYAETPRIIDPAIVIQNNTGFHIHDIRIRASSTETWGSNLGGILASTLHAGGTRAITLPQSLATRNVYDIRLSTNNVLPEQGNVFMRSNVTVTEGMIVEVNVGHLQP